MQVQHTLQSVVPLVAVGGTVTVLRAPSAIRGGAVTVEEVFGVNGATITTAGFTLNLVKMTGGTANGGTVGSFGGTAASGALTPFMAGQAKVYNPTRFSLAAGDTLVAEVVAVNSGTITQPAYIGVHYTPGK